MVVLRAIGRFFARIGRWIRDTAWVQPLLIVGGIFAIIFSIPSITSWVQSWFVTGDAAISFYHNTGYKKLTGANADGTGSEANELLEFVFSEDSKKTDEQYKKFGEKFFVLFVQEDCSVCKSTYTGWQSAIDSWGKAAGFKQVVDKDGNVIYDAKSEDLKIYTIFVDEVNDDDENLFWKLHDNQYSAQFGELSSLTNPYSIANNVSYENLSNSGSTDLSGGSVFSTPTAMLFDRAFADNLSGNDYYCDNNGIGNYKVSEVLFDIPNKGSSNNALEKARTLWDCWNHIGQFDNLSDDIYISK